MTSRERIINILRQKEVDRIPRNIWMLPGIDMFRSDEREKLLAAFPDDFTSPSYRYGKGKRCKGIFGQLGEYTDAWGCTWSTGEPGVIGEVKEPIIKDWSDLDTYELPWELLDEADLSQVNESCRNTNCFVLVGTETRPFERMQFLRGTEQLFMDLADASKDVLRLRDLLHTFYIQEMTMWAATDVDGVWFMDDWGSQTNLLISPTLWRELFKPLYAQYCQILHAHGKFAFFHSDGNIEKIYPDLIEIGVDAINSQLFCMDIERLGEQYAGKITFWGEIDRQFVLPFGSRLDVEKAVDRVANALMKKHRTGVIAQCEWGLQDPMENIMAVFDHWNKK